MSILPRAESKWSYYSWWRDRHIRPKNSKWLQENVKDVKIKVIAMIKLIEEGAYSFARRAEMYYKKRPKLMKLLEELYRAYRALAERYNHATEALRHAHRTMSEAFPNHTPLALMTLKVQNLFEKVKETEHFKVGLEDEIPKLEDMNCTLNEHNSECALKVTHLEAETISLKERNCKLEDEVEIHARSKKILQEEFDSLKGDKHEMDLRHESLTKQMEELRLSLIESKEKQVKTEMALQSSEQLYNQSNDKVILLTLETQIIVEKLKEIELFKVGLEDEHRELEDLNHTLSKHNSECALKIMHLEGEILSLKEIIHKLEDEVEIHVEGKKVLQQELDSLKEDKNEIDLKHQSLTKEMEEASLHTEFLDTLVKKLQSGHDELEECCGKLEVENVVFLLDKLMDMELVSERNSALENSLSEANVELEELRERIKVLEGSCESINAANSTHIGEKAALAFEVEILTENLGKLSVKCTLLESSLDGANTELEELRSKFRVLEELHESLCHENLDIGAQKNDLLSQVESLEQILGNLETTHAILEEKNLNLEKRSSYQRENREASISDHDHSTMAGVLEMQNLIAKVRSLKKLVVDTQNHLDHEKLQSAANLESARREIEELKLKESSIREEKQGMESSPNMVKDIEFDQVSNSCGASRIQSPESNVQTLKLSETPDRDLENRISTNHDMGAVKEVKGEKPLYDLVAQKDIRVHKHEISREIKESQDEWNKMVIKRLATDANKLLALRNNAQQLKLKMERSGMSQGLNRLQVDTLRARLKEAEAVIFDLLERNGKSTMMAEIYISLCSGEEMGRAERGEVAEQVQNGSNRIEMVELELEKIHFIFLKLEEECGRYMTRGVVRTPRMLLRDYLYGRRGEKGKKRGCFFMCAMPRTLD